MKTTLTLLVAALVSGPTTNLPAEDLAAPKEEATGAAAQTITSPAPMENGRPVSELSSLFSAATLSSLGVSTNARVISLATNRLDVLDRPGVRIEGGVVPLLNRPAIGTFFQLFNPFAPAEFGGMGALREGEVFSRAEADPIKTKPTGVLFSVGDQPEKGVSAGRRGDD
jgi:hypothetical protein